MEYKEEQQYNIGIQIEIALHMEHKDNISKIQRGIGLGIGIRSGATSRVLIESQRIEYE